MHGSSSTRIEVFEKSTPPEDFIQGLLNHDLRSETIFDVLYDGDFDGEVCVLRDKNTLYTMVPAFGGLDHDYLTSDEDQDSRTCFCRLDFKRQGFKAECSVEYDEATCYYVRLGWLVEQDVSNKSRITTNYVLLLNVTTKPTSLWLAFDYLGSDENGDDQVRKLRKNYNDSEYYAWYHGRPNILDYNSGPSGVNTSTDNLRRLKTNGGGYLGVPKPFDLAMMSQDIKKDWKGRVSSGLDSEKVLECMNQTGKVFGETLRALPRKLTWSTGQAATEGQFLFSAVNCGQVTAAR